MLTILCEFFLQEYNVLFLMCFLAKYVLYLFSRDTVICLVTPQIVNA